MNIVDTRIMPNAECIWCYGINMNKCPETGLLQMKRILSFGDHDRILLEFFKIDNNKRCERVVTKFWFTNPNCDEDSEIDWIELDRKIVTHNDFYNEKYSLLNY